MRLIQPHSLLCAALLLGAGYSRVHAGLFGSEDIGAEEFPGLLILPAARPAGLAGTYTALGNGVDAVGINPAGLARESGQLIEASLRYHPDLANVGGLAYSRPYGDDARVAITANYINFGTVAGRDENNQPIGDFKPSSFYPALSYARSAGDRLNWGASLKGVLEDPGAFGGAHKALGAGVDAGVQYSPARGLGLGASVVNAGFKFRGHAIDETAGSGYLPGAVRAGTYFHFSGMDETTVSIDAEIPFFSVPALGIGYEYEVMPEWILRAGTRLDYNDFNNIFGWAGAITSQEMNGSALKAAVGTSLRMGKIGVDVAEQWLTDLGFVHYLTVSWRID